LRKRNLIVVNLLLLGLIGLGAWRLKVMYDERLRRQTEFLRAPAPAAPPPVVLIPPPAGQVSAANYLDVATKLPFSKDRNPTVIQEVAAPKPMPALPRYYGMMNFGDAPRIILAPAPGGKQKSYLIGDTIGEFKLVRAEQAGLVFSWDGKEVPARYEELRDKSEEKQAAAPAAVGAAPAASAQPAQTPAPGGAAVTAVSTQESKDAGAEAPSTKPCVSGDNSPAGAVVDGYRKLLTRTPFGQNCRWEKIN